MNSAYRAIGPLLTAGDDFLGDGGVMVGGIVATELILTGKEESSV